MKSLAIACLLAWATSLPAQTTDPFCGPDPKKPYVTLLDGGVWNGKENRFFYARSEADIKTMISAFFKSAWSSPTPDEIDKMLSAYKTTLSDRNLSLSAIQKNSLVVFGIALNAATYGGTPPALQAPEEEEDGIHLLFTQKRIQQDRISLTMQQGNFWIFATTPAFLEKVGLDTIPAGQKFFYDPINDSEKRTFPFVAPKTN